MYWNNFQAALNRFKEKMKDIEPAREKLSNTIYTSTVTPPATTSTAKGTFDVERQLKKVEGDNWIYDTDAAKVTGLTLEEIRKQAKKFFDDNAELGKAMFVDEYDGTGEPKSFCLMPEVINAIVDKIQGEIDKSADENKTPPNLYVEGKISACGTVLDYANLSKWTRQPIPIFRNHFVGTERCMIKNKENRNLICKDCKERLGGKSVIFGGRYCRQMDYIFHCHGVGAKRRIYYDFCKVGLSAMLIDILYLGYDSETQEFIFPLTDELYTTIPLKDFLNKTQRAKTILAHYNRTIKKQSDGTFKATCLNEIEKACAEMPYVDNRFYSTDGRIVYAYCVGLNKANQPQLPFSA